MSDQEGDDDQERMDAMLLRLLKTPPKSRAVPVLSQIKPGRRCGDSGRHGRRRARCLPSAKAVRRSWPKWRPPSRYNVALDRDDVTTLNNCFWEDPLTIG
jgi:hypothetical protein